MFYSNGNYEAFIRQLLRDYGWIGELGDKELTVAIHKNPPRVTHTVL